MNQPIEDSFDFEENARLSVWNSLQYFKVMNGELRKDVDRCSEELLKAKSAAGEGDLTPEAYAELGFWYRNLTRAFMIYVEGLLYVMRRLTIFAHERGEIELSPGHAVLVRETVFTFNTRRKRIEERSAPNRLLENFVLTFSLFPKVFASEFEVNYGVHGWEKFQTLAKIRNDLTHPKCVEDTLLLAELPNTLMDAVEWFYTNMANFFGSVNGVKLKEHLNLIDQMEAVRHLLQRRNEEEATEQSGEVV